MTKQEKFTELDKLIKQLDKIYNKAEKIKLACLREDIYGTDTDMMYKVQYDLIQALNELRVAREENAPF